MLEQYLRMYCSYQQDNWSNLLPLVESAFNNSPSATTGISPFYANKGYHPNMTIYLEHDMASTRARDFAVDLYELQDKLCNQIAAAQKRYQGPADARHSAPPKLQVGDEVFVKAKFFRTTCPSPKLADKQLGPFKVIAQVDPQSYMLKLPDSMKAGHPVYHISVLEPHQPSTIPGHSSTPPPLIEVEGKIKYEISKILNSKLDHRRQHCQLLYLVRWTGYEGTDEETSWLLATELAHALEAVSDFHRHYPSKLGPL